MVSFICKLWWHNSTIFLNLVINTFIFRFADPETSDYYNYFANPLTQNNSSDCPYNKKIITLWIILLDIDIFYVPKSNLDWHVSGKGCFKWLPGSQILCKLHIVIPLCRQNIFISVLALNISNFSKTGSKVVKISWIKHSNLKNLRYRRAKTLSPPNSI